MEKTSIVVLDKNKDSREILKMYLENLEYEDIRLFDDYSEGLKIIKQLKSASIVLVDITNLSDDSKNIIELIKLHTPKIIVISLDYTTDGIIRALRMGAKDFLPKPVVKKDLQRALEVLSAQSSFDEGQGSQLISVYSNKGGIGKTTIAINLASELAKTTGAKVALIDLNLQLGDISTFLNLKPSFDVSYVIKNLINKDDEKVFRAFEKYKDTNLYILSDPTYIEQSETISVQEIESLIKKLSGMFSYVIVDLSSIINPNTLKVLDLSDKIIFTTIVNIPAIRNCQRCLTLFNSRRYSENKIKLIINRYMENNEISAEDVESTLNKKIYWRLPNNYFSVMEAINKGLVISEVNPNSNIANSFKDFASKLADDIVEEVILKNKG